MLAARRESLELLKNSREAEGDEETLESGTNTQKTRWLMNQCQTKHRYTSHRMSPD